MTQTSRYSSITTQFFTYITWFAVADSSRISDAVCYGKPQFRGALWKSHALKHDAYSNEASMASIRIISTPPGFADEKIREQWVGLSIPIFSELTAHQLDQRFAQSDNAGGYVVSGDYAVLALQVAGRQEAADFWSRPYIPEFMRFARSCCEIDLLPARIRGADGGHDFLKTKAAELNVKPSELLKMSVATLISVIQTSRRSLNDTVGGNSEESG